MIVIDTNDNTTNHLTGLKQRGVVAVGRYYSSSLSKSISRREAIALSSAGIRIFCVFENSGDPSLTVQNGVSDAKTALTQATSIGQPTGTGIYFALEHLPDGYKIGDIVAIKQYAAGLKHILDGKYKIGVYSDGVVCQALLDADLCDYTWLSASSSFEGSKEFFRSGAWSLAQSSNIDQNWSGLSVDTNEAKDDFGAFMVTTAHATLAAADIASDLDTPWMDWMRANVGQVQQTGAVPTAFTEDVFSHTNFGPLHGHTPESCAATVCAALEESGYKSTKSAAAISYRNYGTECDLKPGCIVVYQWSDGQHHVNFCDKILDQTTLLGLGGNQSHSLNDSKFMQKYIVATRWPVRAVSAPVMASEPMAPDADGGGEAMALGPQVFTVDQGQTYRCVITLQGFEQLADNSLIESKLQQVGFQNVEVTGAGTVRQATGVWCGPNTTATIDSHLSSIEAVS